MIQVVISKPDVIGPEGKTRILGLQREDLETLSKDGIIQIDFPFQKLAIMFVKSTKEEFLAEVMKLGGVVDGPDNS